LTYFSLHFSPCSHPWKAKDGQDRFNIFTRRDKRDKINYPKERNNTVSAGQTTHQAKITYDQIAPLK
jgi:hypothetical protein